MDNLASPQYSIEKPYHLKNIEDNSREIYSQLQNFYAETYYNNAPQNVRKCIRAVKRKHEDLTNVFSEMTR